MWSDNESEVDLLQFRYLAEAVAELVCARHLLPVTIGLYSDWGGGKSTLLRMVEAELQERERDRMLLLSFNGWLFEGYEDAKTALMGTILDSIESRAVERQSLSEKGRNLLGKLARRVNWLQVAGLAGRYVLPSVLGMPQITLAALGQDAVRGLRELKGDLPEKLESLDPEQLKKLVVDAAPDSPDTIRKDIREFRRDFETLLEESGIETLVVFIDDLDRCLPDTIIETLEAIKLFLFVKGTAFVLAADERLVKYAVRRRFPQLPGQEEEVGRDYLEKLVQIPVRVPPLSGAEIHSYMNLLFAERDLGDADFETVCQAVAEYSPGSVSVRSFDLDRARDILGEGEVPERLEADLGPGGPDSARAGARDGGESS
jgi:predicted KAP-like P-loop ATPase